MTDHSEFQGLSRPFNNCVMFRLNLTNILGTFQNYACEIKIVQTHVNVTASIGRLEPFRILNMWCASSLECEVNIVSNLFALSLIAFNSRYTPVILVTQFRCTISPPMISQGSSSQINSLQTQQFPIIQPEAIQPPSCLHILNMLRLFFGFNVARPPGWDTSFGQILQGTLILFNKASPGG